MTATEQPLSVRFTAEQQRKIALLAAVEDRSQSSVVRRAVDALDVPPDDVRDTGGRGPMNMAAAASTSPRSAACGVAGSEGLGELGPPNAAREPGLRAAACNRHRGS